MINPRIGMAKKKILFSKAIDITTRNEIIKKPVYQNSG